MGKIRQLVQAQEDYWLRTALDEIAGTGTQAYPKAKTLHKFGENLLVGTSPATVMTLPSGVLNETFVSTNAIAYVSSSDAGDTQTVVYEGHTIDGDGNLTFFTDTVTLAGQTKTALPTPGARITRAYNTGATDFAGSVYFYEDDTPSGGVPATAANVHLIVPVGENQSLKCSTALSSKDYALVTSFYGSVNKKTAGGAVLRLQVRNSGGVFRTLYKRGINSNGSDLSFDFRPYLIVRPNSDIRITAEADTAGTAVSAGFNSTLCTTDL